MSNEPRTLYRAEDDPPEPRQRTVLLDRNGYAWQHGDRAWYSTRVDRHAGHRMWADLLAEFGPLVRVPEIRIPATDPEHQGRSDGEPYQLVKHAEWRGGRLYLDGEPFPYATETPAQVKSALPHRDDRPAHDWHVMYVPVVIDGTVDLSGRPEPRPDPLEPIEFGEVR